MPRFVGECAFHASGLLCYLYAPDKEEDKDDFGDGTKIKTHRTRRMCYPMSKLCRHEACLLPFLTLGMPFAVPVGPSKMLSFREHYALGNINFDDIEYERACNSRGVEGVIGTMGASWAQNAITMAPFGAILRIAEGVDSINNLALSGGNFTTEMERGAAILCGVAQMGGLLFAFMAVIASLALCVCAPFGSALALWIYRRLNRTEENFGARDKKLDAILQNENERLLP
jgi:hypothetical protein